MNGLFRISIRAKLFNKEWLWIGDALTLRKDEALHRSLAKEIFKRACTCNGSGRRCALNGIKAIASDFEAGLWRPFLEELHKHQEG